MLSCNFNESAIKKAIYLKYNLLDFLCLKKGYHKKNLNTIKKSVFKLCPATRLYITRILNIIYFSRFILPISIDLVQMDFCVYLMKLSKMKLSKLLCCNIIFLVLIIYKGTYKYFFLLNYFVKNVLLITIIIVKAYRKNSVNFVCPHCWIIIN